MRCFNHEDLRAVGLCKHCNKALCHGCANDLGFGLACRGVHEKEVASVSQIIERSVRVQAKGGFSRYVTPLFYIGLGAVFIGYELSFARNSSGFGLIMGGLFAAYGLYLVVAIRRAFQPSARA